jgi:hypothetical protein
VVPPTRHRPTPALGAEPRSSNTRLRRGGHRRSQRLPPHPARVLRRHRQPSGGPG